MLRPHDVAAHATRSGVGDAAASEEPEGQLESHGSAWDSCGAEVLLGQGPQPSLGVVEAFREDATSKRTTATCGTLIAATVSSLRVAYARAEECESSTTKGSRGTARALQPSAATSPCTAIGQASPRCARIAG
jgi:hypothetical protein